MKPPNYDTILTDFRTNAGTGTGGNSQLFRGIYASPEVKLRFADRINKWYFNGNNLDDRIPTACPIQARKDEMRTTFAPLLLYTHGGTYSDVFWNNWTTATTANPNAGNWTVAMSRRRSHLFNESPTPASNISFRTHNLWPATEPATYSQHGGVMPAGYLLTVSTNGTVPAGSAVYYTTNGTDPREWGGTAAPGAQTYTAPFSLPNTLFTTVMTRVKNGTTNEWSALTEATFQLASVPATAANLVVSQIMYNPPDATAAEITAGFTDKDDFEYLDLKAIGPAPVSLDHVKFIAGLSFDFGTTPVQSPVRAIASGDTVLLVANKTAFPQRYGTSLDAKIGGQYIGGISNTGERIWITGADRAYPDTTANTIKDYTCDDEESLGWPEGADGRGSALLLVNPAANPDHNMPTSWTATLQWAGTPGALMIPVTFVNWLDGHFNAVELADPAITGPDADPDSDGLSNLIEFALGTMPDKASSGTLAALPTYNIAPGLDALEHLFANFNVNAQVLSTLTCTAEAGSDLMGWSPLTVLPLINNSDGTATLKFRDETEWRSASRRFVRLRLSGL